MTDDDGLELYRMIKTTCEMIDLLQRAPDVYLDDDLAVVSEYEAMRRYIAVLLPTRSSDPSGVGGETGNHG